jgi:hypothetical protein
MRLLSSTLGCLPIVSKSTSGPIVDDFDIALYDDGQYSNSRKVTISALLACQTIHNNDVQERVTTNMAYTMASAQHSDYWRNNASESHCVS